MTTMSASAVLRANLERIFNEGDATRRRQAVLELYADDAVLHEQQASFVGAEAINGAIAHLLGTLPANLVFGLVGPVMQNHDMAKLLWRGQLPDGTVIVTGTDIAQVEEGRIRSLHVFVDPPK